MVLYGGLDYPPSSKNEIERFSSMDDILPMETAGEVFLVQLNPGSMINFSFKTHTFFSYNYGSFIPKNIDTNYGVGKTSSPGFSLRGIYIIVCAAVLVPSLLIRCLAPLCKPRSEENDANLTVLTVHLIPSQPNEDDPPSP
uniref:Uncharacterized protein n=1 Tax=Plectus sambesii TaxID=2011161 RepID=A0A914WGS3_9BILA